MKRKKENYRVKWEIDVDEFNVIDAAKAADELLKDPDAKWLFEVRKNNKGKWIKVDMEKI